MTLPAFATIEQLAARIPGGVASSDESRAQATLDDASALIRVEAGRDWVNTAGDELDFGGLDRGMQDAVVTICVAAARRAFTNPEALQAHTQALGDASETRQYANTSNDVYLTSSEKALVRRAAGKRAVGTIATTREDPAGFSDVGYINPLDGCVYAPVDDPEGQMIPWLDDPFTLG